MLRPWLASKPEGAPVCPLPTGKAGALLRADVEAARQAADGLSSGQTDVAPKKTAPVVQAAIAEEQRQMEMDIGGEVVDDEAQMRSAVDGLDMLEATMERSKNGVREGI